MKKLFCKIFILLSIFTLFTQIKLMKSEKKKINNYNQKINLVNSNKISKNILYSNKKDKSNYTIFIQTKNYLSNKIKKLKIEKKINRLSRFLWSLLLVIIVTIIVFFFIKSSIDWATSSRQELNKLKDQRMRDVTEILNNQLYNSIEN
jgi:CBS domain containing-hemolysin-like protein